MKTLLRSFLIISLAIFAGINISAQGPNANFGYDINFGCAPLAVNFTNFSDTSGMTSGPYWDWYIEGIGNYPTWNPPPIIFTEGGTWEVTLTLSDDMGYVDSYTVYVDVYPRVSNIITTSGPNACPGEPVSFYFEESISWYSISWNFGDNTITLRDDNWVDHTYFSAGTYDATLIVDHYCGTDTVTQTINVGPGAIPKVEAFSEGSTLICPNEEVIFNTMESHTTYLWDFGDGATSPERRPIHFYDTQVPTDYQVILSATNACGNVGKDTLTVSVVTSLTANAWFSIETHQSEGMACPNTSVRFVPHSSAASYEWDLGDGSFTNERYPVNYYTEEGLYDVTLTLMNGCGDTASHTESVDIYAYGEDGVYTEFYFNIEGMDWANLQGDTVRVCPGELVGFRNNSYSSEGTDLRYEWDFGDGQSAYSRNASHVYSGPGIMQVTLTATTVCGASDIDTKYVWVDDAMPPIADLRVAPDVICSGEMVFFWDDEHHETVRNIYDIDFGDLTSLNNIAEPTDTVLGTLANHIYTGIPDQTFDYVFTVTNLCGNTASKNGSITITDQTDQKPFYYVDNTTMMEGDQPMGDWSRRRYPTDHAFNIHVVWPGNGAGYPGGQDTFAVFFWYEGFYPDADLGPAHGMVKFVTSEISIGDSVTAYVPINPLYGPMVGFAAGWTCSGQYSQGIEPEVWGMPTEYSYVPINSMPLSAGGNTNMADYGPPIAFEGVESWDRLCNEEKPARNYYYEINPGYYMQLNFDDDGQYYLYATSDIEGDDWLMQVSQGTYILVESNLIEMTDLFLCGMTGSYSFSITPNDIAFATAGEPCPERLQYMTAKPFIRKYDFGGSEDRSACPGDNVLFKIAGGSSYEWHFGDGAISTERYPMHSYALPGVYNAFVIATNSCSRIDTIYTPVTIDTTNVPDAIFGYDGWDFPRLEPVQFYWGDEDRDPARNLVFNWDFGDGGTSSAMNPVHAYDRDGEYMVTLTLTNSCGSDTYTDYLYIRDAILNCEAKFITDSVIVQTAYFRDISRGEISSWFWDFGDGYTSTLQNPSHDYQRDGVFFVCLSIYDSTNDCASQVCHEIQIGTLNCKADFIYSSNDALSTVQFTDRSTNATEWFWDFGDGYFSDEENPVHPYAEPGQYFACLSIYNPGNDCFSEFCMEVQVGATDTNFCFADFSFFVADDNSVKFTDISSNNITNWYWTFGDGTFLESRNPIHTFTLPGIYDVCLIVFDQFSGCTAEICKRIPVGVSDCNLNADYSFFVDITNNLVSFSSKSTGTITDYFWDFGDGVTSTMQNPRHQYTDPGFYLVTLSVRDQGSDCADHTAEFLQIGAVDCRAVFEYTVDGSTNNVQFYNQSQGDITEYFWNFEDGSYSIDKNPSHLFDNPGLYMVSLTVVSNDGLCMDHFLEPVQVGGISCSADFKYFIDSAQNIGYFTPEAIGAITDYLWIFGDGSISTMDNPVHEFVQPGYYTVGLNTYDAVTGCMDYYEEVILIGQEGIDCRADYMYMIDPGTLKVKFKDQSWGDITDWVWDFGDGSRSIDQDTTRHTYQRGGQYMVCLTVVNSDKIQNTYCDWIQVTTQASENCFADFYYSVDSDTKTVSFKDASYGNPDTWKWDLGDGSESFVQNPKYTYDDPDFYLVKLRINNTSSGCTSKHSELVNVAKGNLGLQADFDYEIDSSGLKAESYPVDFVGVSLGDAGKFKWSFDDGTVDTTSMNPTHVFASPGTYYVCLTIWDPVTTDSSSTSCDSVTVRSASVGFGAYSDRNFRLGNYPNPFDNITYITYELPEASDVALAVYDQMGRMVDMLVREDKQTAGLYKIEYNARDLSSGIYILRLVIDQGVATSRMIIR